jgi:4-amino-4-deoxy-L-arabinose transferase-like glycosyltransferase
VRICAAFFVPASGLSAPSFLPPRKIQAFARSVDSAGGNFVDLHLKRPEKFKNNRAAIDGAIAQTVQTPFAGMFFTIGFYSGFIPIVCLVALIAQRKRAEKGAVLALLPVIVLLLFQVISPVAFPRYAMPFVVGAPLLVGATIALMEKRTAHSGRGSALQADGNGEGRLQEEGAGRNKRG